MLRLRDHPELQPYWPPVSGFACPGTTVPRASDVPQLVVRNVRKTAGALVLNFANGCTNSIPCDDAQLLEKLYTCLKGETDKTVEQLGNVIID